MTEEVQGRESEARRERGCSIIRRYCSAAGNLYALGNVQCKTLITKTEDAHSFIRT